MQAYQTVDRSHGRYLPARRICIEEGDDLDAAEATKQYVEKACTLGGRWTSYSSMTERWEYLYISKEYSEEFSEAWRMYQISSAQEPRLAIQNHHCISSGLYDQNLNNGSPWGIAFHSKQKLM